MRRYALIKVMLLLAMTQGLVMAQTIEDVMDHNPFDPMRGQRESEVIETEPVLEYEEDDYKFVLDGTILAGKKKMAIITFIPQSPDAISEFREEYLPESEENQSKKDRRRRQNRRRARKKTHTVNLQKAAVVKLNDTLKGFTISEINRHEVVLSRGDQDINLALYSGEKENRGGTKSLPKPMAQNKKNKVRLTREKKPLSARNRPNKPRNQPRNQTRNQPRNRPSKKIQDLKRRF